MTKKVLTVCMAMVVATSACSSVRGQQSPPPEHAFQLLMPEMAWDGATLETNQAMYKAVQGVLNEPLFMLLTKIADKK